jgi:hypothetical protein
MSSQTAEAVSSHGADSFRCGDRSRLLAADPGWRQDEDPVGGKFGLFGLAYAQRRA